MKIPFAIIVVGLCCLTARAEDWTTSDGKTYKNVTVISHDAKIVTISSSDGTATFPITLLGDDLQRRVNGDNVTAKDWATTDGKTYRGVKVLKYDALTVSILYADGGASVPLEKLPVDLQKKFGYDPVQAQAMEKKQADEAVAAAKAKAEAQKKKEVLDELKKNAVLLNAEVTQVLPNGILADKMEPEYHDSPGTSLSDVGGGRGGGLVVEYVKSGTTIFIEMPTDGVAEHQRLKCYAVHTGTFTFTDIHQASRTVEKWITVETPPSASPSPPSTASQFNPGSINDNALKPVR